MKTNLKDYAHFTKAQVKGIFVLASITLLFFILPKINSKLATQGVTDFSKFEEEITEFETALEKKDVDSPRRNEKLPNANATLFSFDPNTVSKENLLALGLSTSVATTFVNFRNKGFKFYKKEDLKRVYGIKETDYQRLVPYIKIAKPKKTPYSKKTNKTKKQPKQKGLTPFKFNPNEADKATLLRLGLSGKVVQTIINYRNKGGRFRKREDLKKVYGLSITNYLTLVEYIDLPEKIIPIAEKGIIPKDIPQSFDKTASIKIDINNSSVEDWKQLKGIGEITAKRIVNYRDKLGGFLSIDQLKTTYNIADSTIDKVAHQLILTPITHKIPINSISAEALKLHPYIKKKQAYLLINYRTNHGAYTRLEDLKKVKALPPDFIKRIAPYLSFE